MARAEETDAGLGLPEHTVRGAPSQDSRESGVAPSEAAARAFGDDRLPLEQVDARGIAERSTGAVSDSIFSTYLVPFEVVSVLLLAALVGAIVLARKD